MNREEFVVVGWTAPEGSRQWLGELLLAYYDPEGTVGLRRARRYRHRPCGAAPSTPRHDRQGIVLIEPLEEAAFDRA
jgi:hypothetical protein